MKVKKLMPVLVVLLLVAVIAIIVKIRRKEADQKKNDASVTTTAKVERGPLRQSVASTGRVVPNLDVDIKCKASGQIVELPYDISDEVGSGTLILEIDPTDMARYAKQSGVKLAASQFRLIQARLNLKVAEQNLVTQRTKVDASLKSAQARYDDARSKAERMKQLFEKKLASREDFDTAQTTAVQAQSDLENARAASEDLKTQEISIDLKRQDVSLAENQVESDKINEDLAEQQLKDTKVFAPIDGVVSARTVQVGQIISSGISNVGGGTTVLTLSDLSHIYVLASVDESDIGKVDEEQDVMITADAYPEKFFSGKVVRIATKGVNASNVVTFEVKIEVTGRNKSLLKPEMTTNVEIIVADRQDTLLVPSAAISRKRGKRIAFVKNSVGPAEEREVEIGISDGVQTEIVKGLKVGEELEVKKGMADSRWRANQPGQGSRTPSPQAQIRMMMPRPAGGR
jgi:HlyD family secretion protein